MKTNVVRLHKAHDLRIDTESLREPEHGEVLVRLVSGGICGSDLHYFHHGGVGDIRVRDPIILGHEASGIVEEIGENVSDLSVGDTVAINPSTPCNQCFYCNSGLHQHCLNMKFLGSAMRRPHIQGAFRELMVLPAENCIRVNRESSRSLAALSEPLAVCLHAASRISGRHGLQGKCIIITGAGPIGCLCTTVAKYYGAAEIVVTDVESYTLSIALQLGATSVINVRESTEELRKFTADKGYFDVAFECSGVESAVNQAITVLKPQSTLVQVGNAGPLSVPFNRLVPSELTITGSFRFHEEFPTAVDLIDRGAIDVSPIISDRVPFASAPDAFHLASDRSKSVKVLLEF